ncbi:MAG: hypothetical protein A2Y07_04395 [Planctomycetes bacterium GWF2_50_10]|nr:MAG: hypothetical protein A2Y07_04395 [Planctomycetes bacterium GWF2_50_10]
MFLDVRKVKGPDATEIFISAVPTTSESAIVQATEIFSGIKDVLSENNAKIFQERIFGTEDSLMHALIARAEIYGVLNDGVEPACLKVPVGFKGPISGLQVHAFAGYGSLESVIFEGKACGRIFITNGKKYLTISGLQADTENIAPEEINQILRKCDAILNKYGGNFQCVPRTWMWLGNILEWYNEFNAVRTAFFINKGLIRKGVLSKMPASTGIGIGPSGKKKCAVDLVAVIAPIGSIKYFESGGKQNSAYEYGSSFSRACSAMTPAGETFYISGTASIDKYGHTVYCDDTNAQIDATVQNVIAILNQLGCTPDDIAHSLAYCKNAEIEKLFCEKYSNSGWPCITMIADICRDNLLFEIEVTAIKKSVNCN